MEPLRVVMLGKTGAGKSSTGNTLLGRDAFRVARGLNSGTERCQWADEVVNDTILEVIDTPGVCDTHRDEEEVLKEVGKSVAVACPGPHVVLMVLRCDKRFTDEEFLAYTTLKALFGKDIQKHMIVVFVGADNLGDTLDEQKKELEGELSRASDNLKLVLEDAEGRVMGINNKASGPDRHRQALKLVDMMKDLKKQHKGAYFSNDVCKRVTALVTPLVAERRERLGISQSEAEKETKQDILDDKQPSNFFSKLRDIMMDAVIPALKVAIEIATTLYGLYKVAKPILVVARCNVM